MKINLIYVLFGLMIIVSNCNRDIEKRKIKLSDENISTKPNQQLTTTIHLEAQDRRSIAVMFFQNLTGDNNLQWLQKGLTEMLIRTLSQSQNLSVLSTERLIEILNRLDKTTSPENIDLDMAAIVAKEANVETLLSGNISRSGDALRINVKVHEPNQGKILKEESVEGSGLENIFSMVDHLTHQIKQDLHLTLEKDEPSKGIVDLSTNSLEAWRYYTAGVDLMNKLLTKDAVPQFKKAIAADSTFVMSYLRLVNAYSREGQIDQTVQTYQKLQTLRAYATDQELYKMDLLDAGIKGDFLAMTDIYQKWLQKFPDDREANFELSTLFYGLHNDTKSTQYIQKVLSIDPKYKLAINQLGYSYARSGDFTSALSTLQKYKEIAADEPNPYDSIGEIYLMMGNYDQAEKHFKQALKVNENFPFSLEHLANVYIDKGDYKRALKIYEKSVSKATDGMLKGKTYFNMALIHWRLGEVEQAITNFQKSLENNVFQHNVIEQLNDIYIEKNDSTKAHQILTRNYDRMKNGLTSDILQNAFFFNLAYLSLWHDINVNESIELLENILSHADSPAFSLRVKFILTLLYHLIQRQDKIQNLWQEHPAPEIMKQFREAHNLSYNDFWKYSYIFNHYYYQNIDQGIKSYEKFIEYAVDSKTKQFEIGFRLLIADLYFHKGDRENGLQHFKMAGVPEEKLWMTIGPFDNKNGFHKKFPPEKKINLKKTYKAKTGLINWQESEDGMKDGFINLKQQYKHSNWAVAYGLIYVMSPTDKKVQFRAGTNEAVKIWLNDEEVWKFNQVRSAILDDNIVNVTLHKGLNKILIKVCNRTGDWGYYFRITDEEGNGFPDIQFVSPDMIIS